MPCGAAVVALVAGVGGTAAVSKEHVQVKASVALHSLSLKTQVSKARCELSQTPISYGIDIELPSLHNGFALTLITWVCTNHGRVWCSKLCGMHTGCRKWQECRNESSDAYWVTMMKYWMPSMILWRKHYERDMSHGIGEG